MLFARAPARPSVRSAIRLWRAPARAPRPPTRLVRRRRRNIWLAPAKQVCHLSSVAGSRQVARASGRLGGLAAWRPAWRQAGRARALGPLAGGWRRARANAERARNARGRRQRHSSLLLADGRADGANNDVNKYTTGTRRLGGALSGKPAAGRARRLGGERAWP